LLCQLSIEYQEILLTLRQVFFSANGIHRAFGLAKAAIYTFFGIDDQKVGSLVEAVYWTHLDAIGEFTAYA
jgi:hypothetical protein